MALYKRGNVWHYDFMVDGKRFRGSTKEAVAGRARQIESKLIMAAKERRLAFQTRKAPLLGDFSKRFLGWVKESQLEPNSKAYYEYGWSMISKTLLTGMRLDRITTDEVAPVRFPGSPSHVNNALRTLRRMLGKAAEWGILHHAPVIKLAKETGRSQVISVGAETKLLGLAKQPFHDVLLIMLDTGLRPSEVFRMTWNDINWESRCILVPYGKTSNSRRYLPMSSRVFEALKTRAAQTQSTWVFPANSTSGHIRTVQHEFLKARKAAGLPETIVLYSARHTFATQVLAGTGNVALVMKALGHADARIAMRYQHPNIESVRKVIEDRNQAQLTSQFTSQRSAVMSEGERKLLN